MEAVSLILEQSRNSTTASDRLLTVQDDEAAIAAVAVCHALAANCRPRGATAGRAPDFLF